MACRIEAFVAVLSALAASSGVAQDMPNPQAMQMQVQQIMQQRPREAEAAARAFLQLVAPDRVAGLDSLRQQDPSAGDQYWMEVAQLTVQFDMVQKLSQRDSVRAQLVGKMFGLEANARAQQRAYRNATEANRPAIRSKIESLITQHFDLEDQLRGLEIADIERRLDDVRAESARRREKRSEFIKFAVDDIIRDAIRPR
ncbi:MAG TPA: hypothetical protein VKQ05_11765 [Gemmatimonadales bacterium]|nr:hypothetical protein [Gemmatimonadales bacterium]